MRLCFRSDAPPLWPATIDMKEKEPIAAAAAAAAAALRLQEENKAEKRMRVAKGQPSDSSMDLASVLPGDDDKDAKRGGGVTCCGVN
jgi:hypothetical protein